MTQALKTYEVEKVDLEKFESLVYSRSHDEAVRSLPGILRALKAGAEFAGYEMSDASRPHLYTRLASAIGALIVNRDCSIGGSSYVSLAVEHYVLQSVFKASDFLNTDHLLQVLARGVADGGDLEISGVDTAKLLLLYSLESRFDIDIRGLARTQPELVFPAFFGMLSHYSVLTPLGHARRQKLLEMGEVFESLDPSDLMLSAIRDVYMHCSYASGPGKHSVKRTINSILGRYLTRSLVRGLETVPDPTRSRPTVVVMLEWFHSNHAMYRCYAPLVKALRRFYRLVAIVHERATDEIAEKLFDESIVFSGNNESGPEVIEHIRRIKPDVVYYPSVGMNVRCVALSSVRLAPIQIVTMGHPATTMSSAIDYAMISSATPVNPELFSEILVETAGFPPMALPSGEVSTVPIRPTRDSVPRIVIPAMVSKLNPMFLAVCRRIQEEVGRAVQFEFFAAKDGLTNFVASREIVAQLPGAIVHPRLEYNEYLRRMNGASIHLSPFPFGGTNSNIDSMRLGVPIVVMHGGEVHSQVDVAMVRHAGLPDWLIARTADEYVSCAVRLINDYDERERLSSFLLNSKLESKFYGSESSSAALDFARAFRWIQLGHARIKGAGRRYWKVEDRMRMPVNEDVELQ